MASAGCGGASAGAGPSSRSAPPDDALPRQPLDELAERAARERQRVDGDDALDVRDHRLHHLDAALGRARPPHRALAVGVDGARVARRRLRLRQRLEHRLALLLELGDLHALLLEPLQLALGLLGDGLRRRGGQRREQVRAARLSRRVRRRDGQHLGQRADLFGQRCHRGLAGRRRREARGALGVHVRDGAEHLAHAAHLRGRRRRAARALHLFDDALGLERRVAQQGQQLVGAQVVGRHRPRTLGKRGRNATTTCAVRAALAAGARGLC
jgi:hypothetical protein